MAVRAIRESSNSRDSLRVPQQVLAGVRSQGQRRGWPLNLVNSAGCSRGSDSGSVVRGQERPLAVAPGGWCRWSRNHPHLSDPGPCRLCDRRAHVPWHAADSASASGSDQAKHGRSRERGEGSPASVLHIVAFSGLRLASGRPVRTIWGDVRPLGLREEEVPGGHANAVRSREGRSIPRVPKGLPFGSAPTAGRLNLGGRAILSERACRSIEGRRPRTF